MKRLLILSGKGGTGKTTTAAAFIRFSQTRAMADCDVDAPNLHLVNEQKVEPEVSKFHGGDKAVIDPKRCIGCGICKAHCRFDALREKNGIYRVYDVSCEGCGVCEYVCPEHAIKLIQDVAGKKELYLGEKVFSTAELKMGRGNSGKLVTEVKMAMLKHAPDTEVAIIDGSPGIGCPVIASVSGMNLVLVIAEPSLSGISDLKRLVKTTETLQTPLAVCVNKYDTEPEKTEEIRNFCAEHHIHFAGVLPYDKTASKMMNQGKSVADTEGPLKEALFHVYQNTMELLNN